MKIKKNGAIISVALLLLCAAVYLNWNYGKTKDEAESVSTINSAEAERLTSDSERFEEKEWKIDKTVSETDTDENERLTRLGTYMDGMRLELETTRDGEITLLQQTSVDESISSEAKENAQTAMAQIASNAVTESQIESLVMAKGFVDCIAIIGDSGVNVIVVPEKEGLLSSDVAKITDIVISETGCSATDIKVVETK